MQEERQINWENNMQQQNNDINIESKEFQFNKTADTKILKSLKNEWRKSLTAPQDDMWEAFTGYADHWEIKFGNQTIGYTCVNDENRLLQFYIIPEWSSEGNKIFSQFITQHNIKEGVIGTNNPLSLSTAMHFQKGVEIHYYLFSDFLKTSVNEKDGTIKLGEMKNLERFIDFCHESTGGPKEWLKGYISNLINRDEYFVFENDGKILGTFEVRKSDYNPEAANIGMIVSPNHRMKGLGTFLLGKAKETALDWNLQPICGCDKDNIGSIKSIHKNGFRNVHQMLLLKFDAE